MTSTRPTTLLPGELDGKRAVVTGGSRGIGAAIAQNLLDAGATVVTAARSAHEQTPPASKFLPADLSTPEGVQKFADAALEALGGVDIAVHCAGGCRAFQTALEIENDWQHTIDTNFLSAVRLNKALVPTMREGGGSIVHLSSIATISSYPMILHYAAAKAALEVYTKGLSAELAPQGIRVNALCPGNVETPGADAARDKILDYLGQSPEEAAEQDWSAEVPLGRVGLPQDIAEAVSFLVSDRASWITGSNLVIDGGKVASL